MKKNKGITLIALVITIIVMLILVVVTIRISTKGGLFDYAGKAARETKDAIADEKDIADGKITIGGVKYNSIDEYLAKYKTEPIPTTESYVGYYADINDDGTVDGVIYADLAVGKSGQWSNEYGAYSYDAVSDLKDYYISQADYRDDFGTKDVIAPISGTEGNDRFYIMALDDFTKKTFYWYYNAKGKLDRAVAMDYNDFGEGKSNTISMLNDWNNNTDIYGAQYGSPYMSDLWGAIQNSENYDIVESANDSGKWFVPSKAEWNAFGDYLYTNLGVTTDNYEEYGLRNFYWSSSQRSADEAYFAGVGPGWVRPKRYFVGGCMGVGDVNYDFCVRLSATF